MTIGIDLGNHSTKLSNLTNGKINIILNKSSQRSSKTLMSFKQTDTRARREPLVPFELFLDARHLCRLSAPQRPLGPEKVSAVQWTALAQIGSSYTPEY